MANTLTGYQFDKMRVTPEADGLVYNQLLGNRDRVIDGYASEFSIHNNGNGTISVLPGAILIQGRLVVNKEKATLTPPSVAKSWLCITINLSIDNTFTGSMTDGNYVGINNQVSFTFNTSGSFTKESINNGGTTYQCAIATVNRVSSSSINIYPIADIFNDAGSSDIRNIKSDIGNMKSSIAKNTGNWLDISTQDREVRVRRFANDMVQMSGTISTSTIKSWMNVPEIHIPVGFRPRSIDGAIMFGLSPNYAIPIWGATGGNLQSFTMMAPHTSNSAQTVTVFGLWQTKDDWFETPTYD